MSRTAARGRRSLVRHAVVLGCAALAGLVAAVTAPAPDGVGAESPTTVPASPATSAADPALPPMLRLLAHADPGGAIDVAALVGAESGEAGGDVALLAPSTLVEVPSFGARTIAEIGSLGDASLLELALENALGVALDGVDVFDDSRLAEALAPAGTLEVDLHRPIQFDDERGALTLPEGPQSLAAADAMRLLTAELDAGEPDRLVVVQAVLDAWRAALARPDVLAGTMRAEPAAAALARLSDGDVRFTTVPVERLTASTEQELYRLDRDDVRAAMREAYPWALLGGRTRPRVELLNGTGGVGVTLDVARTVVPAGGEVTLTGNVPGFGVTETVVVYYRDEGRRAAEMLLHALGVGRLAIADEPLGVIDVTVVIGADLVPLPPRPGETPDPATEPVEETTPSA